MSTCVLLKKSIKSTLLKSSGITHQHWFQKLYKIPTLNNISKQHHPLQDTIISIINVQTYNSDCNIVCCVVAFEAQRCMSRQANSPARGLWQIKSSLCLCWNTHQLSAETRGPIFSSCFINIIKEKTHPKCIFVWWSWMWRRNCNTEAQKQTSVAVVGKNTLMTAVYCNSPFKVNMYNDFTLHTVYSQGKKKYKTADKKE